MRCARYLILLLATMVCATALRADVVPFSGAEVAENIAVFHIQDDGIRGVFELYPADARTFTFAAPEQGGLADTSNPMPAGISPDGLAILRNDGTVLPVEFIASERRPRVDRASPFAGMTDPLTGKPIPSPPEDPEVIHLEVFFSFEGRNPESLVLRGPRSDGVQPFQIGFLMLDRSVPVSRFSFLSSDARLLIDWDDPWNTAFKNTNLNRIKRKGTTSYLYIEPREVRHEVLIRLREVAPWIGENFETGAALDADRQSAILATALAELGGRNPLLIAGKPTEPGSVRGAFLTLSETGFQVVEGTSTLNVDTTFVGSILSYPISTLPPVVTVTWDMFDQSIQEVPITMTDDAGPFLDWATPEAAAATWTNHLKTYVDPVVSPVAAPDVMFASAPAIAALALSCLALSLAIFASKRGVRVGLAGLGAASLIFAVTHHSEAGLSFINPFAAKTGDQLVADALPELLSNIYIAALEVSPEARNNALSALVLDAAHEDLATELETNLAIRIAGGELARVSSVADVGLETSQISPMGHFGGIVRWSVDAAAGHWGHDHRRRVEYSALVEVTPEGGHWKIAAFTVIEARMPDA